MAPTSSSRAAPKRYDVDELRELHGLFEELAASFHRMARLQNPAFTVEARRRAHLATTWQSARQAFARISSLAADGRVGYYDIKYYTVDKEGCRAARLESQLVSDVLHELWGHVEWMSDCPHLASNVRAMFSLAQIADEITSANKRLSEIIQCEAARGDPLFGGEFST